MKFSCDKETLIIVFLSLTVDSRQKNESDQINKCGQGEVKGSIDTSSCCSRAKPAKLAFGELQVCFALAGVLSNFDPEIIIFFYRSFSCFTFSYACEFFMHYQSFFSYQRISFLYHVVQALWHFHFLSNCHLPIFSFI